jgi:hypothetical protein
MVAPTRVVRWSERKKREQRSGTGSTDDCTFSLRPHPVLTMPVPFSAEQRTDLLHQLGLGQLPTPDAIRQELERDWLLPSSGARKELSGIEWAM